MTAMERRVARPSAERAVETGAASERTLYRRAAAEYVEVSTRPAREVSPITFRR